MAKRTSVQTVPTIKIEDVVKMINIKYYNLLEVRYQKIRSKAWHPFTITNLPLASGVYHIEFDLSYTYKLTIYAIRESYTPAESKLLAKELLKFASVAETLNILLLAHNRDKEVVSNRLSKVQNKKITMKKLTIENWNRYGDYMLFARFVNEVKKWMMLKTDGSTITAIGQDDALQAYAILLTKNKIDYKFEQ